MLPLILSASTKNFPLFKKLFSTVPFFEIAFPDTLFWALTVMFPAIVLIWAFPEKLVSTQFPFSKEILTFSILPLKLTDASFDLISRAIFWGTVIFNSIAITLWAASL